MKPGDLYVTIKEPDPMMLDRTGYCRRLGTSCPAKLGDNVLILSVSVPLADGYMSGHSEVLVLHWYFGACWMATDRLRSIDQILGDTNK